jgi:glycosyltransferase involved in cell wall biosynthesis
MADAIRRAAADPVDSRARGEAGREYALEHYDRAALAQRFVSLVDDLVAGSR